LSRGFKLGCVERQPAWAIMLAHRLLLLLLRGKFDHTA
jgi:hypothetical protein